MRGSLFDSLHRALNIDWEAQKFASEDYEIIVINNNCAIRYPPMFHDLAYF